MYLFLRLCLYDLKESPNVLSSKCGQIKKRMSYSFSSVAMMKYSGRNNFREKELVLAHSSRIQFIMAGKSQQQQLESFWSNDIWKQEVESDGCS